MHKYRRFLRRHALLAFTNGLAIFIFLLLLMVTRNKVPTYRAISYIKTPGHILVQLAEPPELARAEMHTVPVWTLYGDGTLIFQTDPGDNLWRAQLPLGPIQHILDVIINQDHFFASSEQQYGNITHEGDDHELLLTVDANGQQKELTLAGEPPTRGAIDIQSMQVFAIEQFLLAYHPLHAVFYARNSDPDSDKGD